MTKQFQRFLPGEYAVSKISGSLLRVIYHSENTTQVKVHTVPDKFDFTMSARNLIPVSEEDALIILLKVQ